ncbi:Hypothetical protein ORPV_1105 [Orpheovirus IHUMI-LCC2]|uniref:Uncharacterized protein n=1 Tax=Orpheovirus IHUMI-LCC2 TaxID=2023057 RepID=A0A2I2L6C0_9VIRU|nr:Hypothetical protein ORPV_1105 [Orpheovirus IHUMI-LCC2]SNW63009.1 Hypothetical protein ORPV_1105 [Orpheovirus IHUMI-LCC2]
MLLAKIYCFLHKYIPKCSEQEIFSVLYQSKLTAKPLHTVITLSNPLTAQHTQNKLRLHILYHLLNYYLGYNYHGDDIKRLSSLDQEKLLQYLLANKDDEVNIILDQINFRRDPTTSCQILSTLGLPQELISRIPISILSKIEEMEDIGYGRGYIKIIEILYRYREEGNIEDVIKKLLSEFINYQLRLHLVGCSVNWDKYIKIREEDNVEIEISDIILDNKTYTLYHFNFSDIGDMEIPIYQYLAMDISLNKIEWILLKHNNKLMLGEHENICQSVMDNIEYKDYDNYLNSINGSLTNFFNGNVPGRYNSIHLLVQNSIYSQIISYINNHVTACQDSWVIRNKLYYTNCSKTRSNIVSYYPNNIKDLITNISQNI